MDAIAKFMLVGNDGRFFGPGPANLLRNIQSTGSVKEAARRMEVSYSKAWKMIEALEHSLAFPVVERSSGGKKGGGASLTPQGRKIVEEYDKCHEKLKTYAHGLYEEHFSWCEEVERADS